MQDETSLGGNVSASAVVDSDEAELYKIDRVFVFSLFVADKDMFARFYQIIGAMLANRLVNLPLRKLVTEIKTDRARSASVGGTGDLPASVAKLQSPSPIRVCNHQKKINAQKNTEGKIHHII